MAWNETQVHKWNTADTITALRIAFSLFLLFLPLPSVGFFAVYTVTGLTDVLDGWLARKIGTASDFGARLDSAADLLFYGTVLLRLFPVLWQTMPAGIWYCVTVILLVRLTAYAAAAIQCHRFAALHTRLNKLTGAAVFLLPWVLAGSTGVIYSWAVCALAFAASLEELAIHHCGKDFTPDRESVLGKQETTK
ncbi:MAG: CDP-alcohol phosphatidyltransferase family protein [Faecousia sp.]